MSARKTKRNLRAQSKSRLKIESVEPRLLFSADLPAWHIATDSVIPYNEQLAQLNSSVEHSTNESVIPSNATTTLVIIDPTTPDYQTLIDDIKNKNGSIMVYALNAESDGITQVSSILSNHSNIESLQIISHGKDGQLELGDSNITSSTLLSRASEISQWRDTFSNDADILIFGCNLAATDTGEQFATTLGYLTSTDVAASEDKTGSSINGADWALEFNTGSIESELAISKQLQNDYSGVLATVTVGTLLDSNQSGIVAGNSLHTVDWLNSQMAGDISLREAIIAANNTNSGPTTIFMGPGEHFIEVAGSDTQAVVGDFDIRSDIIIVGSGEENTLINGNAIARVFEVLGGASLTISDMSITNAGISSETGGAIRVNSDGTLVANTVDIYGNYSDYGGAIRNIGIIELTDVSMRLNGSVSGGAIFNTGIALLNRVTIEQNNASQFGGGIYATVSSDILIINSTISGNTADEGGGVHIIGGSVINTTVTNNSANNSGGILVDGFINLQNVISTNNTSNDTTTADFSGSVVSGGGNIIDKTTTTDFNATNDSTGLSPLLGALQDNGGKTKTHALLNTSVGIDAGTSGTNVPASDQRGSARQGSIDSGSFEFVTSSNSAPTLDTPAQFSVEDKFTQALPVTVSDADGDVLAFSLTGVQDDDLFSIDTTSGDITFTNPPDVEAPADIGTNNVYNITLTADDSNGGVLNQALEITVTEAIYTLVVTTLNDNIDGDITNVQSLIDDKGVDGAISLREAISAANSENDLVAITFNINDAPVGGIHRLMLGSALPAITNSIIIDGTTDSDYVDSPVIVLDGELTTGAYGLYFDDVSNAEVHGMGIVNFDQTALHIFNSDDIRVVGNYIGTMGSTAEGNTIGVSISNSRDIQIGGNSDSDRNVISGNTSTGILIEGSSSINNSIQGNYIGVDTSGTLDLGNGHNGIAINGGVQATMIGGDLSTEGNVISGNGKTGIAIDGLNLSVNGFNQITGNYIGTNFDGTEIIGNDKSGITLGRGALSNTIGSINSAERNIISGNGEHGIVISDAASRDNHVFGNYIGTDGTGTFALGNELNGIFIGRASNTIIGTASGSGGNLVSGNNLRGIYIGGSADATNGTVIQANLIGTDISGTVAIGNNRSGILIGLNATNSVIGGDRSAGEGNTVSGNNGRGIEFLGTSSHNQIAGNIIGLSSDGNTKLQNTGHGITVGHGASENLIGTGAANYGNIISGNQLSGISLYGTNATHNQILGNYIGTDPTGLIGMGNLRDGIYIANGANANQIGNIGFGANVISDNGESGIQIIGGSTDNNDIIGNLIGTDSTGNTALGNQKEGVLLIAGVEGTQIGGNLAGEGNVISGNSDGLVIDGASNNIALGNNIGTNQTGTQAIGNTINGIRIEKASAENDIGDGTNAGSNLIAGNVSHGIYIVGIGTNNNTVTSNYIGLDRNSTIGIANNESGLVLTGGASSTLVDGNIISGNLKNGVHITGNGTDSNTVSGNKIGTDESGTTGFDNYQNGVLIDLGASNNIIGGLRSTGDGNLISGNGSHGIHLKDPGTSENIISGNMVGTNEAGNLTLGNGTHGIFINDASNNTIGGNTPDHANIISGNSAVGIAISGSGSTNTDIFGNHIGTNLAGSAAIANGQQGIHIDSEANNISIGGSNANEGNLISGNGFFGISVLDASDVDIKGNKIGTDLLGTSAIGNTTGGIQVSNGNINTTIGVGDLDPSLAGNVISGNNGDGVKIDGAATQTLIAGNAIGLAIGGLTGLGNLGNGVVLNSTTTVVGGSTAVQRNLIGSNHENGIYLATSASDNVILGNYIGLTTDNSNVGNIESGISIVGSSNTIGGTNADSDANTITNNGDFGIVITSAVQDNAILGNLIYANNDQAIDLGANGITANDTINQDADAGPNLLQNYPVINQAVLTDTTTVHVEGQIVSTPNSTFHLEFFVNGSEHPSGHGEAEEYLGAFLVSTDANGVANFSEALTSAANPIVGDHISASATASSNGLMFQSTSELSASVEITTNFNPITTKIPDITADEDTVIAPIDLTSYFIDLEDQSADLIYKIEQVTNPTLLQSPSISAQGLLSLPLTQHANGSTDITISATDSQMASVQSTFSLTINPVNDPPVITSPSTHVVNENTVAITTVASLDIDNNTLAYSIIDAEDSEKFSIDSVTGELSFVATADAENPTDFDLNNIYQFTVEVSDGSSTAQQAFTIGVEDVNEASVSQIVDEDSNVNQVTEGAPVGSLTGIDVGASDADISDDVTYSFATETGGLFNVNSTTGVVTVATTPTDSNNAIGNHNIDILATSDDGSFSLQTFSIEVLDLNNNAPGINPGQSFDIDENTTASTIVGTVLGADTDSSSTLQNWTIVSGNPANVFQINATTGEISIATSDLLDYESAQSFSLGVSVSDGTNISATETVEINVLNINEKPIVTPVVSSSILEGATFSQTIHVFDPETDAITITAPTLPTWIAFTDNGNGTATLSGTPGGANIGPNSISISATDDVLLSDPMSFTLNVVDVEHAPEIIFPTSHAINESTQLVGTVIGSDADNDTLTFGLGATGDASAFTINQSTGDLNFASIPDAESPQDTDANNIYQIIVTVNDGNTTVGQAVTIALQDINEFGVSPVSDEDNASNQISEGAAAGTIAGVKAKALDHDFTDSVEFSLNSNVDNLFTIDSNTGVVTVAAGAVFDRETETSHSIGVLAKSSDGSISEQNFTISVTDINDNAPTIQAAQSYSIAEDTNNDAVIATIIASDDDSSSQLQNWSINSGNSAGLFEIDQNTGELSIGVEKQLDYETTPQFILGIKVTDGVNTSSIENVFINVSDVNEAPEFTTTPITNATENVFFSYPLESIDPESAPVEITSTMLPSWLILTNNLDNTAVLNGTPTNAEIGSHTIILNSNDGSLSSEPQIFSIIVSNTNDLPVIAFPSIVNLDENIAIVGTVSSSDADGDTPTYSLANTGDASLFEIDAITGELSFLVVADAENPVDNDNDNVYNVTVQVSDGSPTLVSQAVVINIINIDEFNASNIIDQNTSVNEIIENNAIGSTIGLTAQAYDQDSNDTITYSLDNNANNRFEIDAVSGVVTTAATLDFETGTSHNLNVRATSSDGSFSVQPFTVFVTDLNDNAPVINPSLEFAIYESAIPNALIGNISASDMDTVGTLQYWQIESGNTSSNFTLHPTTGELGLASNSVLDFEETPQYTLSVTVSDGLNNSTNQDVIVNILDENEAPVFITNSSATATELISFNFVVIASDIDTGDSIDLTASSLPAWLTLSTTPGSNTATISGTPENSDVGQHDIQLEVTDSHGIITRQTLSLIVVDVNQNPVITSSAKTTATENALFNYELTAIDPDNDALTFTSNNLPAWLTLTDSGNGIATLQGIPENADVGTHSFFINIDDGEATDIQLISIEVINTNDLPEIVFPDAISINENTTHVGTVTSYDVDDDMLVYSLANTGDYQSFSFNSATGELNLSVAGDVENAADLDADNVYEITVEVNDGSPVPASKDFLLTILDVNEFDVTNLIDINSNANTVLENSASGTSVGIRASANDSDISDSVSYSLLDSINGLFSIDESTGDISLSQTAIVDYEQAHDHTVVVQATSSDGSTSSQGFNITVSDANDNSPVISASQKISIFENASAGQSINSVQASDVDTRGLLQNWTIVGGNDDDIFAINPLTGELIANDTTSLNFEKTQQYALQIQVSDGLQTVTQTIDVSVVDVNEPPVINKLLHTSVDNFVGEIGSIEVIDPETSAIASFVIVGGSGQANFEFGEQDRIFKSTSVGPGVYTLDVIVTDAGGMSTEATLEIRVLASDSIPALGGAEPTSSTEAINGTVTITSSGNKPEPETVASQEVTESKQEKLSEVSILDESEYDAVDSDGSSEEKRNQLFVDDTRFAGLQARQEVQHQITDSSDSSRKPNSGKSLASVTTVAMEVLVQNSEYVVQDFNLDFDTLNFSTTLTPALLTALSDISSDINSASRISEVQLELAIKTGTAVSVTLTVGFITWLMQTGAFLTTALSTAPLWRSLDPIPVLISSDEYEDDDMKKFDE